MKKFMLKKWYPSLCEDIEEGIEVEYKDGWIYYVNTRGNKTCVEFDPNEFIFTDFWEEVKQPSFITDDGMEVFLNNVELFAVNEIFETASATNFDFNCCKKEGWKLFFHKSNADEYIWKNKPVFSYEDFIRWGNVPYERVIKELAMERIKK